MSYSISILWVEVRARSALLAHPGLGLPHHYPSLPAPCFSVLRKRLSGKGSLKDDNIRRMQRKTARESQSNPEVGDSILTQVHCPTGQTWLPCMGEAGRRGGIYLLTKATFLKRGLGFWHFRIHLQGHHGKTQNCIRAPFDFTIYNCSYFESCVKEPGGSIIHNLFIALASKELQIPSPRPPGNLKNLT